MVWIDHQQESKNYRISNRGRSRYLRVPVGVRVEEGRGIPENGPAGSLNQVTLGEVLRVESGVHLL